MYNSHRKTKHNYTETSPKTPKSNFTPSRLVTVGICDQTPQELILGKSALPPKGSSKNKRKHKQHIATLNVRSLKTHESLIELENALETINCQILGLSEVRKTDERIEEYENYILYYKNEKPGLYGVGFLIKKYLKNNIIEFKGISDRIAVLNIELPGHNQPTSIIQVYAPTEVAKDEIKDAFYEDLKATIENSYSTIIILGDFNGQIGKREQSEEDILGPFTTGRRNDNGQRLINLALENNLRIMNSFYKKKHNRRWTWVSPNGTTKNEIDFIITNKPTLFLNVEVLNKLNYNTDHRMVRAQIHTNEPKKSRKSIKNATTINLPIPTCILEPEMTDLEKIKDLADVQLKYNHLEKTLQEIENKARSNKTTKDKIGPEARDLINQRRILIGDRKNNKQEIVKLSKEIRKSIRQ